MVTQILPINCQDVWREISNFIEGDVDAELRRRLETHFHECDHCLAILDGTRNVVSLVSDGRAVDVPQDLGTRLYDRLKKLPG